MTTQTTKHVTEALESGELSREGYDAMRAFARWHLGDNGWANHLLSAYLNPEATMRHLEEEKNSQT